MKVAPAITALLMSLVITPAHAKVYNVDFELFNNLSASFIPFSGSISSDGTLGAASFSNFASFDFVSPQIDLSNLNSNVTNPDSLLFQITPDAIYFRPAESAASTFVFNQEAALDFTNLVRLDNGGNDNGSIVAIQAFANGVAARGGSGEIATAVPEPSTWAMILLGFGGLSLTAYRKTCKVRGSPLS